ncbi:TP53-regulated inhibitor of apoptosis 1-like [Chrysoperla carnea]|uniref:TP53-regulated inhibitor of apoptosis 1-like n=1 Tax=Chrysoperla carnea TaxID=189513 RepID=UPI001D0851D9|nr:TP53-regulated inhibitor of apoptosis 1-like [Chrysoperla carnea]
MNSIGSSCNELKRKYDDCFNVWFAEHFLKGKTDDSMCAPFFKVYQQCVKKAMKEHQIEFSEVEKDLLGSENECKVPPKSNASAS